MKTNQHVQPIIADDFSTVTFKVKAHDDIILTMSKLHPSIIMKAAAVGMAQVRIVDRAAVPVADEFGKVIPEAERLELKYTRMASLVAHYETGSPEWAPTQTGGGGKSITLEAIAQIKGVDYETAQAYVAEYAKAKFDGDTKKTLAFLREGKAVQEKMAEIRAASLPKAKVDADAALDELK